MIQAIDTVRVKGDSVGGVVTCIVKNAPRVRSLHSFVIHDSFKIHCYFHKAQITVSDYEFVNKSYYIRDLVLQFLTNLKLSWLKLLYPYLQRRVLSLGVDLQVGIKILFNSNIMSEYPFLIKLKIKVF